MKLRVLRGKSLKKQDICNRICPQGLNNSPHIQQDNARNREFSVCLYACIGTAVGIEVWAGPPLEYSFILNICMQCCGYVISGMHNYWDLTFDV